jgi:protein ImuA
MPLTSIDHFSRHARHAVWRADELGAADEKVVATGHALLDRELPGGGWPMGAMTEVLVPLHESQVWRLLMPALARRLCAHGGWVVLVGAPHVPFGPALSARGLPPDQLLCIHADDPAARAWSCEQALRCAEVAAVLAWLPQARTGELRRLQLAAAQHEGLLFVLRPESAFLSASPARLRLRMVASAGADADEGVEGARAPMVVQVLKRRGPPLDSALSLPTHGDPLATLLTASRRRRGGPAVDEATRRAMRPDGKGPLDAMDRAAVAA